MVKISRIAEILSIPIVVLAGGSMVYQEFFCSSELAHHRFVKYAQTSEGREKIMANLQKLKTSPDANSEKIGNLENVLSSAATTNVVPIGLDCLPSVALGNENADDIFEEYLRGERSI